jgi:hypothetical protein
MQRGKRGVDVAHPGLLDDEEEAAEGLAGVEEEGGRVVDDEDVDELELLPALASLRKTRMKKAGTSDWPADTQRRGAGPGRRAGSMMSATKTWESRGVEHELRPGADGDGWRLLRTRLQRRVLGRRSP